MSIPGVDPRSGEKQTNKKENMYQTNDKLENIMWIK